MIRFTQFSQFFRPGGSNKQAFWQPQPMRLYRLDLNFIASQIMNSLCTEYQHQSFCRKRSGMPRCCRLSLLKIQIHASRCLGLFAYIHRLRLQFIMANLTGGSSFLTQSISYKHWLECTHGFCSSLAIFTASTSPRTDT